VALRAGEGGLLEDSVALCHQVTTLDRGKLAERLGRLSEEAVMAVDAGLVIALDLNRPRQRVDPRHAALPLVNSVSCTAEARG